MGSESVATVYFGEVLGNLRWQNPHFVGRRLSRRPDSPRPPPAHPQF
jgi:hypothetical protein